MLSGDEPHLPSALCATMVVVPALSTVIMISLGASAYACTPTIDVSQLHVTSLFEPWTAAGIWNMCVPSNAEYIGLKAMVSPPALHTGRASTVWESGFSDAGMSAGDELLEQAAI